MEHTFCHFRKLRPQPLEVDQRRQQRRDLDVRLLHDHDDEVAEGREPWRRGSLRCRRCGGRGFVTEVDHPRRLKSDVGDHVARDVLAHELDEGGIVLRPGEQGGGVTTF